MGEPFAVPGRENMIADLTLRRVPFHDVPWQELDTFADRNIFQTKAWLQFAARTFGAEPVVAQLTDGRETLGWFTALRQSRFGVRILGSPFAGWATSYLGFNLEPRVDRRSAFAALPEFAFREMRCLHLEVRCRETGFHDLDGLGYERGRTFRTSTLDLRADEEALFARMNSACRRAIRKSEKEGVLVEEAHDVGFADEYFTQLVDVFDKQGIKPHFRVDRVRTLIEEVGPTGNLLLLRAVVRGKCVATGIFPAFNRVAYFWGGASLRDHQLVRPNEALMWHAMRALRERGIEELDMGGIGSYKAKYGPHDTPVPAYARSRVRLVAIGRRRAEQLVRRIRGLQPVPEVFVPQVTTDYRG
jgi:CelD/BcsL family acetyltransferase involved in cellulose biosynthesis